MHSSTPPTAAANNPTFDGDVLPERVMELIEETERQYAEGEPVIAGD
jgi:hypothetical protein